MSFHLSDEIRNPEILDNLKVETKKTAMFYSAKDSIPIQQKINVINKVTWPGCNKDYVEKIDQD